jgi:hypothetical protein
MLYVKHRLLVMINKPRWHPNFVPHYSANTIVCSCMHRPVVHPRVSCTVCAWCSFLARAGFYDNDLDGTPGGLSIVKGAADNFWGSAAVAMKAGRLPAWFRGRVSTPQLYCTIDRLAARVHPYLVDGVAGRT